MLCFLFVQGAAAARLHEASAGCLHMCIPSAAGAPVGEPG